MFGVYFGKFLENKGLLTSEQLDELLTNQSSSKVKLGLLAVDYGYMTTAQADEVNRLQQMQDKRFGDIAVEKGYLTNEQVEELLEGQGDGYLLFIQALIEKDILTLGNMQTELNDFKKTEGFTARDVEAIKSGDINRIAPIFMKDDSIPDLVKEYVALTARDLVRFVDTNIRLDRIEAVSEYATPYLSAQKLEGDHSIFTGFGGDGQGILQIAENFAKEEFAQVDMDVLDAACEFLNCNNGLYATNACTKGIEIDMEPPIMKDSTSDWKADGVFYRMPLYVKDKSVDLIISLDQNIK